MARQGYSDTRDPFDAGDVNPAQNLRDFFAANLTTWTVGSLQTFGTSSNTRGYFVLTQGSHEILVGQGNTNPTTVSYTNMILSDYRTSNDEQSNGCIAMAYASGGGYATGFVGGYDPASDALFWPALSTSARTLEGWNAASTTRTMYLIENTSHAELIVYVTGTSNYPSMWAFSENMFDTSRTPLGGTAVYTWQNEGVYSYDVGSPLSGVGTISRSFTASYATELSAPYESNLDPFTTQYDFLTDSMQPIGGEYMARRLASPIVNPDGNRYGQLINFDRAFMREFGDTTSTFGRRFTGGLAGEDFAHMTRFLLTPWASALGDPIVP